MESKDICIKLFRKLNNIKNLNSGGCGIAAYAVYKALKKLGIEGFNILAFFESEIEMEFDSFNLDNGNFGDVCSIMHILLETPDGNLIDSSGISDDYWKFPYIVLDEDELEKIINFADWNPSFNRERWVPVIESRLGVELNIEIN